MLAGYTSSFGPAVAEGLGTVVWYTDQTRSPVVSTCEHQAFLPVVLMPAAPCVAQVAPRMTTGSAGRAGPESAAGAEGVAGADVPGGCGALEGAAAG